MALLYHTFAFLTLFSYGLYHLILSTRSHFKNPAPPRPYHPLPIPPHRHHLLRNLPLYLAVLSLLLSISRYLYLSLSSPSISLSPLHTAVSLSLFLALAASLLLPSPPLPPDLVFLLASLAFLLLSLSPSPSPSPLDLQSKSHSLSSSLSLSSSALSLLLSLLPSSSSSFLLDLSLASSVALQGLWSLQTGLSLYVDSFIPEGCHRLLDLSRPSTLCDLDDSRVRAGQVLDLALAVHASFVAVVAVSVYVAVGKACGGGGGGSGRRFNGGGGGGVAGYEALPRTGSGGALSDLDQQQPHHVQMKAIAQA